MIAWISFSHFAWANAPEAAVRPADNVVRRVPGAKAREVEL